MPRVRPHFKIHLSIRSHPKTLGVTDDDALLAMYVRAGLLAVERYAARTGGQLHLSRRDLEWLTGTCSGANAELKAGRLVAATPLTLSRIGAGWVLTIPNLARKQGFAPENVNHKDEESDTSESDSYSESEADTEQEKNPPPAGVGTADSLQTLWLRLRASAALVGKSWAEKPGPGQRKILTARLRDYSEADLEAAVRGYVTRNGTAPRDGFEPLKYLTAKTVFAPSNIDQNVEAHDEDSRHVWSLRELKARRDLEPDPFDYDDEPPEGWNPDTGRIEGRLPN